MNRNRILFFALLAVLFVAVSWPTLSSHIFTDYDDFALVDPMRKVDSLSGYMEAVRNNRILDIAPMRDLSYWLELRAGDLLGVVNHQAGNVALWLIAVAVFYSLLGLVGVATPSREAAAAIVAFHPIMHSSVYWIAGRKHLLSALFIICATRAIVRWHKESRGLALAGLFFLLSIVSQPINVGFPVFAAFYLWRKGHLREFRVRVFLALIGVMAVAAALGNALYYASDAYQSFGGAKFRGESVHLIAQRFLVWGRYIFQLVFPVKPSVIPYNLPTWPSFVGLALMSGLLYLAFRFRKSLAWEWLILAALPIAVVTVRLTNQGGLDNYLLTPLFALGVLFAIQLERMRLTRSRLFAIIGGIVFSCAAIDFGMANVWSSKERLFQFAYQSENSSSGKTLYLRYLLTTERLDLEEAWRLAMEVNDDLPEGLEIGSILGRLIFTRTLTPDQKQELFQKYDRPSPWYAYYWSAFDAQNARLSMAVDRLNKTWDADPAKFYSQFQFNISDLESKWTLMCNLAKREDCDAIKRRIEAERVRVANARRGV